MKIKDIINEGYYNLENDKFSIALIDDTRRPRFTLKHLNNLRKMKEFKKFEHIKRLSLLKQIYSPEQEDKSPF